MTHRGPYTPRYSSFETKHLSYLKNTIQFWEAKAREFRAGANMADNVRHLESSKIHVAACLDMARDCQTIANDYKDNLMRLTGEGGAER